MELPKGLALLNVRDLLTMIEVSNIHTRQAIADRSQWNEQNKFVFHLAHIDHC
jgi:hypothetical protein